MPARPSKDKTPVASERDVNVIATRIAEIIAQAQKDGKNPYAVALSQLGASKGGKARAQKLSSKQRSAIARKAARTRWNKHR